MGARRGLAVCIEEGCPELIPRARARCELHTRVKVAHDRSAHAWVYSSKRWAGVRRGVLRMDRWCAYIDPTSGVRCTQLAVEVDHIVGIEDGGDIWARSNLQGLCKAHHSSKTMREVRARG